MKNSENKETNKTHAGILALAAIGLVFWGNSIAESGGVLAITIGTGMGLFGNGLLIYSLYRGITYLYKQYFKK